MQTSYLNLFIGGVVAATLSLSSSHASSGKIQPNTMPSCSAYSDIVTCNASKSNKGKGTQCMFLLPNNERGMGERSGSVTCQAINDRETVDFFKRINIKEIADLYPDLYEYDESSKIGNPNGTKFNSEKRRTIIGSLVGGYISATLNLKKFYELCVVKSDEETCTRAIFDRNKDFMLRDVQNEETDWSDNDSKSVQWDKIPEDVRPTLMAAEINGNEREVTQILLQIKAKNKAARQAASKAAAEDRNLKIQQALEREKEEGAAERYDSQCKTNTSGDACRRMALRTGGILIDTNCTWLHKGGMMGGGTCRYANAVTCEELIAKDCNDSSSVLTELKRAKISLQCELNGSRCATAG